jgi:hypothetical protein
VKARLVFLAIVAVVFGAIVVALDGLRFEPVKDEPHFWQTSLRFSEQWIPSVKLLRDYGELSTPLPFLVFGWLERATGHGLIAGRLLNLLLSFGIIAAITLTARGPDWRVLPCVVGLLVFPYYLGVSAHLYTDVIAAAGVFGGVWLWSRERQVAAAACFVLAIASRQYMVAFPLGLAAFELWRAWSGRSTLRSVLRVTWIAPAVAAATLGGWFLFFGGPAPPGEMERQGIATAGVFALRPQHALYGLTCLGAYFVIPEWLLLSRRVDRDRVLNTRAVIIAIALAALFTLFPPQRNPESYNIETMGFLDKAAGRVLGDQDVLRMIGFLVLAVLAGVRFSRWSLATVLVWANAAILLKAHIGWDKYILPLLVVLWFLDCYTEPHDTDGSSASPGAGVAGGRLGPDDAPVRAGD